MRLSNAFSEEGLGMTGYFSFFAEVFSSPVRAIILFLTIVIALGIAIMTVAIFIKSRREGGS